MFKGLQQKRQDKTAIETIWGLEKPKIFALRLFMGE